MKVSISYYLQLIFAFDRPFGQTVIRHSQSLTSLQWSVLSSLCFVFGTSLIGQWSVLSGTAAWHVYLAPPESRGVIPASVLCLWSLHLSGVSSGFSTIQGFLLSFSKSVIFKHFWPVCDLSVIHLWFVFDKSVIRLLPICEQSSINLW